MLAGLNRPAAGVAGDFVPGGPAAAVVGVPAQNLAGTAAALPAALAVASSHAAVALAVEADRRLGLPSPTSRIADRLTDTATGLVLDEVTDLDAGGTPFSISRFDMAGRLVSSVRLGFVASTGQTIPAAAAAEGAAAIVASLGVTTTGSSAVTPRAAGGWLIRWSRTVAGIPVPGDGVGVQLAADGSFHAIVRTEHQLAAAPAAPIDPARLRLLAGARLDGWLAAGLRREAAISSIALAWVAPNDTFGDAIPGGPRGVLRLAWIVRVTTSGSLAGRFGGLELAFDAGNGTPLGGDLLE